MIKNVTVLGTTYEAVTFSTSLAILGHKVIVFDPNPQRIRNLQRGIPFRDDAKLTESMKNALREGKLCYTSEPEGSLASSDVVVIAEIFGEEEIPDHQAVLRTAECLTGAIVKFNTVLITASISKGSCRILQEWLDSVLYTGAVDVVACPLFIEKPNGLKSFFTSNRIVLGYQREETRRVIDELFAKILSNDPVVFHVSWEAVEMMYTSPVPKEFIADQVKLRSPQSIGI